MATKPSITTPKAAVSRCVALASWYIGWRRCRASTTTRKTRLKTHEPSASPTARLGASTQSHGADAGGQLGQRRHGGQHRQPDPAAAPAVVPRQAVGAAAERRSRRARSAPRRRRTAAAAEPSVMRAPLPCAREPTCAAPRPTARRWPAPAAAAATPRGSGTVWNSSFIGGAYSTTPCSSTLSASPPSSQGFRSTPQPQRRARRRLAVEHVEPLAHRQHREGLGAQHVERHALAGRQANQPKVTATDHRRHQRHAAEQRRGRAARSSRGTGARRISSPSGGSITRFTVTVPSVTMLIHRINIVAEGTLTVNLVMDPPTATSGARRCRATTSSTTRWSAAC